MIELKVNFSEMNFSRVGFEARAAARPGRDQVQSQRGNSDNFLSSPSTPILNHPQPLLRGSDSIEWATVLLPPYLFTKLRLVPIQQWQAVMGNIAVTQSICTRYVRLASISKFS